MRGVVKLVKIVFVSMLLCVFLLLADVAALGYMELITDDGLANLSAKYVALRLDAEEDDAGELRYALSEEGADYIDRVGGFAFLLNDDAAVVWSYRLPSDLPTQFSLAEVVSFTRYYLKDYPVSTYICDNGILVVGAAKHSVWKYQLSFQMETMELYKESFWLMLAVNAAVLIIAPFLIVRHDARRQEKERTAWIAGVSHDIRTPLSLVLGHADALAHSGGKALESRAVRERARVIEEQALRMKELVTNLNMENKLAYGMGSWHKEKIILPALLRDTICTVLNRSLDEKYDICVIIPQELEQLCVRGDRGLLNRMFENLINNAVRHNPQGCQICVSLSCRSLLLVKRYTLEIADNGRGVSRQQLKAFRRRAKSDRLPEHGLGIRLVRRIAAIHHWRVRFSDNEGGGLRCRIGFWGCKKSYNTSS